ncbi:uncharacterized protein METZ01_LOCUS10627 [marine metagenome]|uniref:Uncharacterized protein n=1 Tax=marine metagenome TaxID=408172 RepID=A0A381NWC0_9ZZZZ
MVLFVQDDNKDKKGINKLNNTFI